MSASAHDVFHDQAGTLAAALERRLRESRAPHYRAIEPELLRRRCASIAEAFVESLRGDPAPFVDYIRLMTEERISEGYYLEEVQEALSGLEERAWQLAIERSNIEGLVRNLTVVTTTIGRAKDELARLYLAHKERADSEVARLQQRLQELFKGTEGHVEE